VLAATTLVALALLVPRVSFVPLWDGGFYAECVLEAVRNGLRPYWLQCVGHSSQVYVILSGVARWLAPNVTFSFLVVDSLLFVSACVGFYRLMRLALPSPQLDVERAQATGAFMLQPSFLAAVLRPNIDLPVLAGFVWCLVSPIERRWVWTMLVGLAIVFSKETGVLLCGVTCAVLRTLARGPRHSAMARSSAQPSPISSIHRPFHSSTCGNVATALVSTEVWCT
jgi:hypothetical protein